MAREISDRERTTREILRDLHQARILLWEMRKIKGISRLHRRMIKESQFMIGVTCYNMEKYLAMKGTRAKDYKAKLAILNKELLARGDGISRLEFRKDWKKD